MEQCSTKCLAFVGLGVYGTEYGRREREKKKERTEAWCTKMRNIATNQNYDGGRGWGREIRKEPNQRITIFPYDRAGRLRTHDLNKTRNMESDERKQSVVTTKADDNHRVRGRGGKGQQTAFTQILGAQMGD